MPGTMAVSYVSTKTARLDATASPHTDRVLIFGDEVEVLGPALDGHVPVLVRGDQGLVDESSLTGRDGRWRCLDDALLEHKVRSGHTDGLVFGRTPTRPSTPPLFTAVPTRPGGPQD